MRRLGFLSPSGSSFLRLVATALPVALVVTGLSIVQSSAVDPAAAEPSGSVTQQAGLEKPDPVSAMVAARTSHRRVEDLSQRDEMTRVFANPNGTWTAETASEPERMQDEQGTWHDIDTTLERRDGGVAPAYALSDVVFSNGGDHVFASMTTRGKKIEWRWPGTLPKPTLDGDTATYADVLPGADLVVTALGTGFTHSVVLREAPAKPVRITVPVVAAGAQLTKTAQGGLEIATDAGKTLVSASRALMWDASENAAGDHENVAAVDTEVGKTSNGRPAFTLTPDEKFLSDPDTVYPVTVDPSFTTYTSGDAWLENPNYTTGQVSSPELRVGTYDGGTHVAKAYMHFGTTKWNGKHIQSANLVLRNYYSGSCTGADIQARRIQSAWDGNTLTWANKPSGGSVYMDTYKPAHGYNSTCDAADATWTVTGMVQDWADGSFTNNGILLRASDETSIYSWRRYRSANYSTSSVRPHINVTYNSYPNKAGTPSVSPGNTGYTTTTTPTLKSVISDPDGGELRAKFTVYNSGGTAVWTGYSCSSIANATCTTSGGTASATVPSSAGLANGSTYTVKAWAEDGTGDLSKTVSTATSFKVDTAKPTVTITASGFTDNQWEDTAPASNTFTLTGSSDTSSFDVVKDSGSASVVAANSSGVGSLSWNVSSGWHTLKVTPHDKAGNVAASATTFSFGVNKPAFASPRSGEGSLGVFSLAPEAQSGASSMTLEWRNADKTAWNATSGVTTAAGDPWNGATADSGSTSTPGTLLWDASQQTDPATGKKLSAPRLLEVRACFSYPATQTPACSDALQVQLDDGFGTGYPTTNLGPATVALVNGAMSLFASDAATGAVGLGRVWSTNQAADTTDGPFGRGWQSASLGGGASETTVQDNRAVDGTFVISYASGGDEKFTKKSGSTTTYVPVDTTNTVTKLELDESASPDTLKLSENTDTSTPTVTSWHLDAASGEWVLDAVNAPGTGTDVAVSSTGTDVDWISQVEAGSAASCTATTQSEGCRGLLLDYDANGHVTTVTAKVHATGSSSTTSTVVATYGYTAGMLSQACGADPDDTGPQTPLCVAYEYDTTGSAPQLTSVTPPGQKKWVYTYDPNNGRVTGVKRTFPDNSGDASWAIDYNVSLTDPALPDMSASAAAEWGQDSVPTRVYAVYSPQADGGASTADPTQAQLFYTQANGSVTNTAVYGPRGWLVDTKWFDQFGNVVQSLDGDGWARVQEAPAAGRPAVAHDASSFRAYNSTGERLEEEYGPVTTATLKDGTTGQFRAHTTYVYDDQAPTLGGPKPSGATGPYNLVVETRHAASDPTMDGTDYDVSTIRNEYDPVVSGDGNGWQLGLPTRVKTQEGNGWSTAIQRYDADGSVIESRQPGGAADASGAGSDAHATRFVYYTSGANAEDSDCGGKPGWEGLVCKTTPAAQPAGTSIPVTWNKAYTVDLLPSLIEETSGTTVRTTSMEYDALGRLTGVSKTVTDGGVQDALPSGSVSYNEQGQATVVQAGGKDTKTEYDAWGRPISYTDALGTRSVTTYNPAGAVATFGDGAGSYTYSYTPHGILSSIDAGAGIGSFAYQFSADGEVDQVSYPNGLTAAFARNETGVTTDLTYSQGTTTLLGFGATVDVDGRTLASSSAASEQNYTFDGLGRLTGVEDVRDGGCTTRSYGFDASSNRTSFASYAPDANGDCQQTTAAVSRTNSYDAAGRVKNPGYVYDDLGRTTAVPAADTSVGGAGDLTATYYPDDMVKSLSQQLDDGAGGTNATTAEYGLDPAERINTVTRTVNGLESSRMRYRYSSTSDSPSLVETSSDAGASWQQTRYVSLPGIGLAASSTAGTATLLLSNLHGDTVATQANTAGASSIDSYTESDEYGNPIVGGSTADRYQWLGAEQRSTDALGGMVLMGARLYNPSTGLFLSTDPLLNGGDTRYGYPADPVNLQDLTGEHIWSWLIDKAFDVAFWSVGFLCKGTLLGAVGCGVLVGAALGALKYGVHCWNGDNGCSGRGFFWSTLDGMWQGGLAALTWNGVTRVWKAVRAGYRRVSSYLVSRLTTFLYRVRLGRFVGVVGFSVSIVGQVLAGPPRRR